MSDTEDKLFPKKVFCYYSLETGVLILALIIILINIVHIGVASYYISFGPKVTDFAELVDGNAKEEVYRITYFFCIFEKTAMGWEHWIKWHGGLKISFSLLFFLISIIGIVGVLNKKQIFVKVFGSWIAASMGFWITEILFTVTQCDDFSISSELAWTLIIAYVVFLIGMLSYFFICVYSLRLKLRKDEKEEQQV